LGFEFTRTEGPRVTPSVRSALEDLGLDTLTIVHAGTEIFSLTERVRALALRRSSTISNRFGELWGRHRL
jgi:uncharacterized protein